MITVSVNVNALDDYELKKLRTELEREHETRFPTAKPVCPPLDDCEIALCLLGRKISAIKAYRLRTGFMLRECKEQCDTVTKLNLTGEQSFEVSKYFY